MTIDSFKLKPVSKFNTTQRTNFKILGHVTEYNWRQRIKVGSAEIVLEVQIQYVDQC